MKHSVKVRVKRYSIASQTMGSADEHTVGAVHYSIEVDGEDKGTFSSPVKLIVGEVYSPESLEVSGPAGYSGPFDHVAFRHCVREFIGRCIHIDPGVDMAGAKMMLRMCDLGLGKDYECEFTAES